MHCYETSPTLKLLRSPRFSRRARLDNIGGETPLVVTTARDLVLRRAMLTERRQRAGPRARASSASRWSFRQPHRITTVRPCRRPEIRTRRDGRRLPEVLPRATSALARSPPSDVAGAAMISSASGCISSSSSDMRACAASQPLRCIATLNPARSLSASTRAARISGAHASQASMYSSRRLSNRSPSAISAASTVTL